MVHSWQAWGSFIQSPKSQQRELPKGLLWRALEERHAMWHFSLDFLSWRVPIRWNAGLVCRWDLLLVPLNKNPFPSANHLLTVEPLQASIHWIWFLGRRCQAHRACFMTAQFPWDSHLGALLEPLSCFNVVEILLICFVDLGRQRQRERACIHQFTPQITAPASHGSEARSWELSQGLLHRQQGAQGLNHHLLPHSTCVTRQLDWKWSWDSNPGIPGETSTTGPKACPCCEFRAGKGKSTQDFRNLANWGLKLRYRYVTSQGAGSSVSLSISDQLPARYLRMLWKMAWVHGHLPPKWETWMERLAANWDWTSGWESCDSSFLSAFQVN